MEYIFFRYDTHGIRFLRIRILILYIVQYEIWGKLTWNFVSCIIVLYYNFYEPFLVEVFLFVRVYFINIYLAYLAKTRKNYSLRRIDIKKLFVKKITPTNGGECDINAVKIKVLYKILIFIYFVYPLCIDST